MPSPRLPRPATILAFAALLIALTGSAIAAKKYLITSTGQIKPSVLAQLRGHTGPAGTKGDTGAAGAKGDTGAAGAMGDTGAAGANGTNGTNGIDGAAGSSATGATMGMINGIGSNATYYVPLNGAQGSISGSPVRGMTPNVALVLKDFAMRAQGLVSSESITVTVQLDAVDTAVTCTVTAPATQCTSSATLNLPARSNVGLKLTSNALGGGSHAAAWSWTFA